MHYLPRSLFALLTATALCGGAIGAAEKDPVLELRAYAEVFQDGSGYVIEIRSFLVNRGKVALTAPTSTYSGHWSGMREGGDSLWYLFDVGFDELDGHRLNASPYRFFPVVLEPNDITELPTILHHTKTKDSVKSVAVSYSIDPAYAKSHGWWSGRLRAECIVGAESPFMVPITNQKPILPPTK